MPGRGPRGGVDRMGTSKLLGAPETRTESLRAVDSKSSASGSSPVRVAGLNRRPRQLAFGRTAGSRNASPASTRMFPRVYRLKSPVAFERSQNSDHGLIALGSVLARLKAMRRSSSIVMRILREGLMRSSLSYRLTRRRMKRCDSRSTLRAKTFTFDWKATG